MARHRLLYTTTPMARTVVRQQSGSAAGACTGVRKVCMLISEVVVVCRHGFYGILLLAAWPNAAFDLCGICCGHFLMPFWSFFGATFIGKALFKVASSTHSCMMYDLSIHKLDDS